MAYSYSGENNFRHDSFGNTGLDSMRIVLLGKTGSGKSSLANTIFGEQDLFKVCHSSYYGTTRCQTEIRQLRLLQGRKVQLIDTPGLFDTNPNAPDFKKEILNCMTVVGVHAFLLVLKVERFTKHELSVAEVICQNFSVEALNYTTVVFTQGDQMEEGLTIKEWIRNNEVLSSLVQRCGGRCHVVDNKHWNNSWESYRNNRLQVVALLNTIDQTVIQNKGRCYSLG